MEKFDCVFAKIEGLSFIEKLMMYRKGKRVSALKLRAALLIQKFARRWIAKLKEQKSSSKILHFRDYLRMRLVYVLRIHRKRVIPASVKMPY